VYWKAFYADRNKEIPPIAWLYSSKGRMKTFAFDPLGCSVELHLKDALVNDYAVDSEVLFYGVFSGFEFSQHSVEDVTRSGKIETLRGASVLIEDGEIKTVSSPAS